VLRCFSDCPSATRPARPILRRCRAKLQADFRSSICKSKTSATRDLLLPRLLSGQVTLPTAPPDPMPHATRRQLVEQPAIQIFAAMGWETVSALDEAMGSTGILGRETTAESWWCPACGCTERLNPKAPPEALAIAIESLAGTLDHEPRRGQP